MCSRRIIMEDDGAVCGQMGRSTDVLSAGVGEGGGWDHVWLDAIIGVVAGHDEKVIPFIFLSPTPRNQLQKMGARSKCAASCKSMARECLRTCGCCVRA